MLESKRLVYSILNKPQAPEELSGIFSSVFFTWINPILIQGYKNILADQNLPPLRQDLKPEVTRQAMIQAWYQRC